MWYIIVEGRDEPHSKYADEAVARATAEFLTKRFGRVYTVEFRHA